MQLMPQSKKHKTKIAILRTFMAKYSPHAETKGAAQQSAVSRLLVKKQSFSTTLANTAKL